MNKSSKGGEPSKAPTSASADEPKPQVFPPLPPEAMEAPCHVTIAAPVVHAIRRHARLHMHAEVCGVLIGDERPEGTLVEAAIPGENAQQGGAHVTFTQETWEHIYTVKDRDYPDKRIVGWYHSHPGFGIFLSRQDSFIHENFFSAPFQVAWVYDPQSEEEGCFGWVEGKLQRLGALRVVDPKQGELDLAREEPQPVVDAASEPSSEGTPPGSWKADPNKLRKRIILLFSLSLVFVAGLAAGLLLIPRTLVMYSFPDGRLLTESEMRTAVERAFALQENQRGNGQALSPEEQPPAASSDPNGATSGVSP